MCGEHGASRTTAVVRTGSSPHVRGALDFDAEGELVTGIIPACAGSTTVVNVGVSRHRDHPRMCGEHSSSISTPYVNWGSSPHVRGARWSRSPRSRRTGIIPACAGSTWSHSNDPPYTRDHPRMCGEHFICGRTLSASAGSSPHVRGALARRTFPCSAIGDHPRMCGEHNRHGDCSAGSQGSSPHVRGARWFRLGRIRRFGIIPACAGSTRRHGSATLRRWDHPRMCGEHVDGAGAAGVGTGSSPHVRGAR